jgi:chemotaxis protein MotA
MKFSFKSLLLIIVSMSLLGIGIADVIGVFHFKEMFPFLAFSKFFDIPSLFIVTGGLLTNAFIINSPGVILEAFKYFGKIFSHPMITQRTLFKEVDEMVGWATEYKRNRVEFLNRIQTAKSGDFSAYVFSLVSTNYSVDEVITVSEAQINEQVKRSKKNSEVFKNMGNSGPAFGMFGTLFGLVYMLSSLDDPTKIGPGLALGLLVTLYGVSMTHLLFYPLSMKILIDAEMVKVRELIILDCAVMMMEDKSPIFIKDKLQATLDRRLVSVNTNGK